MNTAVTQKQINPKGSIMAAVLKRLLQIRPELSLCNPHSSQRNQVEAYIAQQFKTVYGANISEFMPHLMNLSCQRGLSAVVGVRPAGSEALFLEQYLSSSIEQLLTEIGAEGVARESIAEIGNLAATHKGSSQLIFLYLSLVLQQTDIEWVVFTATTQVQKIMARCGFDLHVIAEADVKKLKHNAADWGSYYDSQPKIAAVNVQQAVNAINSNASLVDYFSHYQIAIEQCAIAIKSCAGLGGLVQESELNANVSYAA